MTSKPRFRVIKDPDWGYRRLDPIPDGAEVAEFYESRYYELVRKGGRACELGRFLAGGQEAEREREWLRATLYGDLRHLIRQHAPGRRVLDVGCGMGELLVFLKEDGLTVSGTEPSLQAAEMARSRGIDVHSVRVEEYLARRGAEGDFDAMTLLNVLEHVPRPADILHAMRGGLAKGGILCVRVPNDFNELQKAAIEKLRLPEYWIAVPDHINYFDYASLKSLLERTGFEVIHALGDFPMEIFLLMGDDYVHEPHVGARCHERRRSLEMGMPEEVRRRLYAALALNDLGRNCLMVGRRVE